MARLQPRSHYEPEARLSDYFLLASDGGSGDETRVPLLSVLIPIHSPGSSDLLAVAELIQDGKGIARELALLDRHLLRQGALAFGLSGGIVTLALGWAFRRLQTANRKLLDHAAELRRANQELALAAKTSALGTVTAHVMHGLTSPLMGLQNFVASHASDNQEWQDALRGTQRMQALIGEFLRVLGEQTNGLTYELPLSELAEIIAGRTRATAQTTGVQFSLDLSTDAILSNRDANLVLLILENLLKNAVQATPRGKTVCLRIASSSDGVVCEVHDEGPGLPAEVRDNLFTPCRSTKSGGNGIGLALSQQLARHLGAQLSLVRSNPTGSVFALRLPSGSKVNGRERNGAVSMPHSTTRN
jgi:signal transduction histidine kinase